MELLQTERLDLVPLSLELTLRVLAGHRSAAEAMLGARFPEEWPGRALVERAFVCPVELLRRDPERALWGGRVLVTRPPHDDERRVVGSVVFSGAPDETGTVEVAYGIDGPSQGHGYATEGTRAVVEWALTQGGVARVMAATPPWHRGSLRVLEKLGMRPVGARPHELFGELLLFERLRSAAPMPASRPETGLGPTA